jgi:hypothetical protein
MGLISVGLQSFIQDNALYLGQLFVEQEFAGAGHWDRVGQRPGRESCELRSGGQAGSCEDKSSGSGFAPHTMTASSWATACCRIRGLEQIIETIATRCPPRRISLPTIGSLRTPVTTRTAGR